MKLANNEDFDKSLVEKDDMVVLEIISEKLIKELQVLLKTIDAYKSKQPDLEQFNSKKEHLSALIKISESNYLLREVR
jgi:hypothetical protein